jgi:NADP-dependent 3-hydroxy acid dehydrogenase YdfG
MKTSPLKNRRVWVTGASSGLGSPSPENWWPAVVASRCQRVAARSWTPCEAWGPDQAMAVALDVRDREANRTAVGLIEERWGGLDIAFLNAGTCEYIDAKDFRAEPFEAMMRTNFMSMVYGIEAALPALRRSPHPILVGMSSTARYAGLPRAEAYGASKAACAYLLESLRLDLLRRKHSRYRWSRPVLCGRR